jgi:hypothetical protein
VTEEIYDPSKPLAESSMIVTRIGEEVTLNWNSAKGFLYTVSYSDKLSRQPGYRPLPGYVRIPGTGGPLQARDRVPLNKDRRYQLSVVPVD